MSNICSLEEELQVQTHGKLAWINRNEKSFKKINLILLKPIPKCLWLILTFTLLAAASLVAQHKCPPLRPCCSSCVADQCSWSLSLQSVCCRSWGTGQNCFLASLPALLWPQQAVKAGRWALEYLKPWHLWALIVFFSQQVFNPNLSFNEWNLTEMEASLSPVSNVCFWDSNNNNDDDDARLVHNWRMLRYFTDRGESVKAQQIHICCG